MNVHYHRNFIKSYKKRIESNPKLDSRFKERLELFLKEPSNPVLKDHALVGKKSAYRAFSVTGDIRTVYKKVLDGILLYDIGTHAQVY